MTLPYDPRVDWAREDDQEQEIAKFAADYARNVEAYHAEVRELNARHREALDRAHAEFSARNVVVVERLQRLVIERRISATIAGYARRLRGE